ncbi:MAG: nodulation S family protein [Actinomycetota bacterium]|nr:nodulation S family protein [Actinomycetota bacterium]MDQ2955338.1 nodulation S family protein [Actinomycetota bacterium]
MSDPVDVAYLEGMYAANADPWQIGNGWYEQRKRELLLGCLPRQRYRSAFEPGCSAGILTEQLARRADRLLAADLSPVAVRATRDRVSTLPNVEVRQLLLPRDWPSGQFDLIVLSELGYFFAESSWTQLCAEVAGSLGQDGTVIACHWRHDFAERSLSTPAVHECLDASLGLPKQASLVDADFILEVWTNGGHSVATEEGLV